MKIAVIGCSHSSGLFVSQMGIDREQGWVPYFASLFPQHQFVSLSTESTGYPIQNLSIEYAKEINCDVVILQMIDIRSSFSVPTVQRDSSTFSTLHEQKAKTKNFEMISIPRDMQASLSHDNYKFITDFNKHQTNRLTWAFGRDLDRAFADVRDNNMFIEIINENDDILLDNFKYWIYNMDKLLSSYFEHYFIYDFSPYYYNYTIFKDIIRKDWEMSVYEWFHQYLKKEYNISDKQSIRMANTILRPLGGHLPIYYQHLSVDEFLLTNERLVNLLE